MPTLKINARIWPFLLSLTQKVERNDYDTLLEAFSSTKQALGDSDGNESDASETSEDSDTSRPDKSDGEEKEKEEDNINGNDYNNDIMHSTSWYN